MKANQKPPSRQRLWQLEQHRTGLCTLCAERAVTNDYCQEHRLQTNNRKMLRNRKINGWEPWRPGGRGRPPLAYLAGKKEGRP